LGDRYGRKRALLIGLAVLGAAAIWASQASDPNALIVSRGTMGVGAALVMPATLSILVSVFPSHERAKAIAVWGGFAGAGGAIGIIGGGVLLESFWWGSIFFINVPIVLIAAGLISTIVPTSKDDEERPLDPVGAVLSIIGFGSLVYAIIEGGEIGWLEGSTLLWFTGAVISLVALVVWELRTTHPMLDPRLFRHKPFGLSAAAIALAFLVMFGFFFILTLFFQLVVGYSPLAAGVRFLPFTVAMILVAPRSPEIAARLGKRGIISLGLLVQAVAFLLMSTADASTGYWSIALLMGLLAAGMALVMPAASEAIISSLPQNKAGVGSAVNDTTREIGGALGIAGMGSLLASGYRTGLGDATAGLPAEAAELAEDGLGSALRVAAEFGTPELVSAAQDAFVDSMATTFVAAAVISVCAAAIIFLQYPKKDPHFDDAIAPFLREEAAEPN